MRKKRKTFFKNLKLKIEKAKKVNPQNGFGKRRKLKEKEIKKVIRELAVGW